MIGLSYSLRVIYKVMYNVAVGGLLSSFLIYKNEYMHSYSITLSQSKLGVLEREDWI